MLDIFSTQAYRACQNNKAKSGTAFLQVYFLFPPLEKTLNYLLYGKKLLRERGEKSGKLEWEKREIFSGDKVRGELNGAHV